MQKFRGILLMSLLALGLCCACGSKTPPQQGAQTLQPAPAATDEYVFQTNAANKVFSEGAFDTSLIREPVLITSIGQSADVFILDALFQKLDTPVDYDYKPLAAASEIPNYKTVLIATGMSSKGLDAAGVSPEEETERAKVLLKAVKENNLTVIFAHLGGSARWGVKSDQFSDMALELSSYLLVVEEGNAPDGKFSSFARENGVPYSLIYTISDCLAPLNDLFA